MEATQGLKFHMGSALELNPFCDSSFFNGGDAEWKKLMYNLLFTHGVILARRGYGHLGWSLPYDFADGDLHLSLQQLQEHLTSKPGSNPHKLFRDMILECNYGARITEPHDKRLLGNLLLECCSPIVEQVEGQDQIRTALTDAYARPSG